MICGIGRWSRRPNSDTSVLISRKPNLQAHHSEAEMLGDLSKIVIRAPASIEHVRAYEGDAASCI